MCVSVVFFIHTHLNHLFPKTHKTHLTVNTSSAFSLQVTLVYLVALELVAHQDHLTLAHLGPRVFLDPQVQWVPLVSSIIL